MSLINFFKNTDPKVVSAIIGGLVLLLSLVINSFVNVLLVKRRVRLEIDQWWRKMQIQKVSVNLDPSIEDTAKLLTRIEQPSCWGNVNLINAIVDSILKLREHTPKTSKLIKVMEKLKVLLDKNLPSGKGVICHLKIWQMKRRLSAFVREAQIKIKDYRDKF